MKPGQRFAVAAIFASLGPAAGAAAVVIAGVIMNIISRYPDQDIMEAAATLVGSLLLFVFSLIIAYPAAIVPAALTGLVMAAVSGRVTDVRLWLAVSVVVGAASAALLTGWPFLRSMMQHDNGLLYIKAGAGAFAGLVSAATAWPVLRERRAKRAPAAEASEDGWSAG